MRILRHHHDIPNEDRGASAAIGNFDGVHRGHQKVIDLARAEGERIDAPLGVVTFEPHPREVFDPDAPPFRLMNAEAKANRLAKLGVRHLYQIGFDRDLARLTPREFAGQVLSDGLGLRHVVVGADFCFGCKRAGNADDLTRFGAEMGFTTTIVPLLGQPASGRTVSSTAIRQALADGRPRSAKEMLGHWHRIDGPVLHGEKRGRQLGFPTANMSLEGLHQPKFGVYAVSVDVLTGPDAGTYGGVASLGVRPMFGENVANLETHLFDFKGDLYGQHLSVALVDWLRSEQRFDSIDALVTQMHADSAEAKQCLAAL